MRFVHLLPLGACVHHCCTSEELVVLRDQTNRVCGVASTVYGGNKVYGVSAGSLIVKTVGSIWERLAERHIGDPLARAEGPRLSTELPNQELGPCEGLQRGLGEACALLDTSVKILESSMRVCISTTLKLPHLHCYLSCVLYLS